MTKRVSTYRVLIFLMAGLITYFSSEAQRNKKATVSTSVSTDRREILPGEQVNFTVSAKVPASLDPVNWVEVSDSLGMMEVLKRGMMDSTRDGEYMTYHQSYTLTAFDSGTWVIPPLVLTVAKKKYKTDTLSIAVVPVPLKGSSYNDVHEIIEVPPPVFDWKKWIPYALALLLTAFLVFYYFTRRKKAPVPQPAYHSKLSPYDQAVQELKKLKEEKILEGGEVKTFHARLVDILRVYLVRQFKWPVLQSTTDEVLIHLKENKLNGEPFKRLASSLRMSDAVKFAKYSPPADDSREAFSAVDDVIRELQNQKKPDS